MAHPVDEFFEAFEKEAGPALARAGKMVGDAAIAAGAGALATGAVGAVSVAARKLYEAATHGRDFRNMLAYNPDLEEHRQQDERLFNQQFRSLRNMNPQFSADPIVAGTYMRSMLESPMNAGNILRESLTARDKMPSLIGQMGQEGAAAARESLKGSLKTPAQEPQHPMGPMAGMAQARPRNPDRATFGSGSGRPMPRGSGAGGGGDDD